MIIGNISYSRRIIDSVSHAMYSNMPEDSTFRITSIIFARSKIRIFQKCLFIINIIY